MPLVLMQEMGHAGGLGHPPVGVGVMSNYNNSNVYKVPTAMDARGMREAMEPHTH